MSSTAVSSEEYNASLAKRQAEINEWSYHNKMDTLFVMQVLFISLLLLSILFYFKSVGAVSGSFVWYVFIILFLIVGLIIINRAAYTTRLRDGRFWNRRKFEEPRGAAAYIPAGGQSGGAGGACKCP